MQVKLNESGLRLLGWDITRGVTNFTTDRAYHLMKHGYANQDKPFMTMYEANLPKKPAAKEKPKPDPKPVAKKEKATSRKAAVREKAVKK